MSEPSAAGPTPAEKADRQLAEVAERLCREFAPVGGPDADVVRAQVREARAAFDSPTVLTYLSVMVERAVRHSLGATPFARESP